MPLCASHLSAYSSLTLWCTCTTRNAVVRACQLSVVFCSNVMLCMCVLCLCASATNNGVRCRGRLTNESRGWRGWRRALCLCASAFGCCTSGVGLLHEPRLYPRRRVWHWQWQRPGRGLATSGSVCPAGARVRGSTLRREHVPRARRQSRAAAAATESASARVAPATAAAAHVRARHSSAYA